MDSYARNNSEETDPLQGIRRQLTRVASSLEALEDIARWHVSNLLRGCAVPTNFAPKFGFPARETEGNLGTGDVDASTGGSGPDGGLAGPDTWTFNTTQRSRSSRVATPPSDGKHGSSW
jgi:hypothetical protein